MRWNLFRATTPHSRLPGVGCFGVCFSNGEKWWVFSNHNEGLEIDGGSMITGDWIQSMKMIYIYIFSSNRYIQGCSNLCNRHRRQPERWMLLNVCLLLYLAQKGGTCWNLGIFVGSNPDSTHKPGGTDVDCGVRSF